MKPSTNAVAAMEQGAESEQRVAEAKEARPPAHQVETQADEEEAADGDDAEEKQHQTGVLFTRAQKRKNEIAFYSRPGIGWGKRISARLE